jgi:hypothetical protein
MSYLTRAMPGMGCVRPPRPHLRGRGVTCLVALRSAAPRRGIRGRLADLATQPVAVAASTLAAAAALFNPLKDAVDLDAVQADLAGVVHKAVEPARVSIRMRPLD